MCPKLTMVQDNISMLLYKISFPTTRRLIILLTLITLLCCLQVPILEQRRYQIETFDLDALRQLVEVRTLTVLSESQLQGELKDFIILIVLVQVTLTQYGPKEVPSLITGFRRSLEFQSIILTLILLLTLQLKQKALLKV